MTSRYLIHVVQSEVIAKQSKSLKLSPFFRHTAMSSIAQAVAGALPHLSSLTSRPDLSFSDTLVIQTVYLAISPLFITEPPTRRREGKSGAGQAWGVM
jgi:cohesin loading factor subunit SCC2